MTTDERLERLAERHEAMAESLELLKSRHEHLELMVESLTTDVRTVNGHIGLIAERLDANSREMTRMFDKLVNVAVGHARRFDEVERDLDELKRARRGKLPGQPNE